MVGFAIGLPYIFLVAWFKIVFTESLIMDMIPLDAYPALS